MVDEEARLAEWNDARGFGFAETGAAGERLFVHISAFPRGPRRPATGDQLLIGRGPGRDGRPAVVRARFMPSDKTPVQTADPGVVAEAQLARAVRLAIAALLALELVTLKAPEALMLTYVAMGTVSFSLYAIDKRAARRNSWRVPERLLLLSDAACGLIGGMMAQVALRHKTAKRSYTMLVIGMAFVHALLLAGFLMR